MKRMIAASAALAAAVSVMVAPGASAREAYTGAASAGQSEQSAVYTRRLQLEGTNRCLDAPRPGGYLQVVTCTPGDAQLWTWSSPAISTSLAHRLSRLCAERVEGGTPVRVRSTGCDGDPAQRWDVGNREGYVVIRANDSTQCLTAGLSGITMRPCADTPGQRWKLA